MDGLQRVTFRFGPEIEVRYLRRIPEPGDFVSHANNLWVVSSVSADIAGTTVVCWATTATMAVYGASPDGVSSAGR